MAIRIIPDNTRIQFMWLRRFTFPVSVILSVLSVIGFIVIGPNYGIDFRGGSLIEIKPVQQPVDMASVRSVVAGLGLGDVQVQAVSTQDGTENVLLRVEQQEGGDEAQQVAVQKVREAFGDTATFERVEIVGPRVSSELAWNGTIAMTVTLLAILIYVWFRFEWQFAVGAIIATIHDVVMTLGFYSVVDLEFNLSSIAAILTIVGYSLNDTVVVYDRIRETLRKYKKVPLTELIDRAINETLARTTITSLTTWIALWALFIFGGEVIRSFVGAMIFGIAIGTYSSIFIAAPVLIFLRLRTDRPNEEQAKAAQPAAGPT